MIKSLRQQFNAGFTASVWRQMIEHLEKDTGQQIEFRICETPVFFPADLLDNLLGSARDLITQLRKKSYLQASDRAVPEMFHTLNEGAHPSFIQVDFAITRNDQGQLVPKLIELQAWASLYAFQLRMSQAFAAHFDCDHLKYLLSDLTIGQYTELFRRTVLGEHAPENVVLMEIEPEKQKTRPDFFLTEKMIGVPTVDITHIRKNGRRLFYVRDGQEIPIHRLYNRAIIDELVGKNIVCNFDFRDELDVEWAGHPNWFFRWSKFSLPFLEHPSVPRAWFVSDLPQLPDDLENFVLKPLFSFAGSGVKVNVTRRDIEQIPENVRSEFLLQEKIVYEPVIAAPPDPHEKSKLEIRVMFLWPDDEPEPIAANLLARLSKGLMMGVDFNKNKTGVGSSSCFFE